MNKWMQASLCGMILLAASGCSGKDASPSAVSPAAASATPSPAATTTATATPTPQVSVTATPAATPAPAATASPVAVASATPQPQASATPSAKPTSAPTPVPASATPAPTAAPTPVPSVKPQETPASIPSAKAELLYKDNCLACHGAGLTGDYGPNLTKVGSRRTKEQIVTQIMNGKIEMPPFKDKLKPEEIESLAIWLSGMK